MNIAFVEIRNFRKLKSVRVEFSESTTLLVGANNSGKTSATFALGNFLERTDAFTTNDFTLSDWPEIEAIAQKWESNEANLPAPTLAPWEGVLPSLDVWIEFGKNEVHHARAMLPTLDWTEGKLPADIEAIEGNPLTALIRVNIISAQRGFSEEHREEGTDASGRSSSRPLSDQLRNYYIKHLNPEDAPEPEDMDALEAIEKSQSAFSDRLNTGFASALKQLEDLNYPGIADPRLRIRTQLIVSTHSSHIAHESEFGSLRYFRRLAPNDGKVPVQSFYDFHYRLYCNQTHATFRTVSPEKANTLEADHFSMSHCLGMTLCIVSSLGGNCPKLKALMTKLKTTPTPTKSDPETDTKTDTK